MRVLHVVAETPLSFLQHLKDITYIERRPLRCVSSRKRMPAMLTGSVPRFCAERLQSLVRTLELSRLDELRSLQKVASFATLVATYEKGARTPCRYYLSGGKDLNLEFQDFSLSLNHMKRTMRPSRIRCFTSREGHCPLRRIGWHAKRADRSSSAQMPGPLASH